MQNVEILYGDEPYVIKRYVDNEVSAYDECSTSFYEEFSNDVWAVVRQMPMFSERQLVVVKPKNLSDEKFLKYCKKPMPHTHLLVIPEQIDKRTAAYKELQKLDLFKECNKLDATELQRFVVGIIKESGCQIRKEVYDFFIERSGYFTDDSVNLFSMDNYVRQLCSTADEESGNEIVREAVESFVVESNTTKTFAMTKKMLQKDRKALFSMANHFLQEKESAIGMLSLFLRSFRLAYKATLYPDKNETELGKLIGVPAYQFKDAMKYRPEQISGCLDCIQDGIRKIKAGSASESVAFTITLARVMDCLE